VNKPRFPRISRRSSQLLVEIFGREHIRPGVSIVHYEYGARMDALKQRTAPRAASSLLLAARGAQSGPAHSYRTVERARALATAEAVSRPLAGAMTLWRKSGARERLERRLMPVPDYADSSNRWAMDE
jgi:hypothetical protein